MKLTSRSGFQLRFATGVNLPTSEVLSTPVVKILSRILNRRATGLSVRCCVPSNVGLVENPHARVDLHSANGSSLDELKHSAHRYTEPRCRISHSYAVDGRCRNHGPNRTDERTFYNVKKRRDVESPSQSNGVEPHGVDRLSDLPKVATAIAPCSRVLACRVTASTCFTAFVGALRHTLPRPVPMRR